jgi:hypothetical protein
MNYLKKFLGTLIATFILILLAGYLYFFELKKPSEEVSKEGVFADIKKEQINEISLKYSKYKIGSKKEGEGWFVFKDSKKFKADEEVISTITDNLSNMKIEKIVSEDSTEFAGFGLDTPQVEVVAKTPTKEHRIVVGGESPVGTGTYIQVNGENRVLLVERSLILEFLDKSVNDLRDKQVVRLDGDQIKRMRFKSAGLSFEVERQNGEWVGKGILEYVDIDRDKIEGVMRTFSDLRISDFENDEPENLASYGLDTPRAEVELIENGQSVRILFGNKKEDGAYYVKLSSEDSVYSVSELIFNQAPKELNDIRVIRLVKIDTEKVSGLEIKRGETTISIVKEENNWILKDDKDTKINELKVQEILGRINELEVRKSLHDNPTDLAPYGLDRPETELTISESDKKTTLLFGKDENEKVYGKLADGKSVYVLTDEILSYIPSSEDEMVVK